MSKKIKNEQKKFLGETLNQYDKALDEAINQLDKKNREQNHKISSLVNSFDNEYLEKDVEGNMTALENSKDGMVIINEIQGSTEVNYCKDGEKELILNGDIDTQGESFVTITEGVDGGLVDVALEGNTEINLSKTKDLVLVTREFDDINCNVGKLQYTIDDVTTINDEPGKVDIDRIVGDTMVNHAVNGSEELILNAHINESGDNSITLNGATSDGGKVDVALEGNTLVNVSKTKDSTAITKAYTVENSGNHIALQGNADGNCKPVVAGNTLWIDNATEEVLTAFDKTKNLRLQSSFEDNLVTQEMVDNGEEVADNLSKYRVEYRVTGKDKLNINDLTFLASQSNNGMTVSIENDKLYIEGTATGTYDFRPASRTYNKALFDIINKAPVGTSFTLSNNLGGKNYWSVIRNGKTQFITNTITKQQGDNEIHAFVRISQGTSISKSEFNIQIEEGDTATPYEPYKEHIKTLYLNSPLLEGDTIEEKNGGIYHVHRSKIMTLTGDDSWGSYNVEPSGNSRMVRRLDVQKNSNILSPDIPNVKWSNSPWNVPYNCISVQSDASAIFIYNNSSSITDLETFKTWLTNNPVTIIYELASLTYELIEQSNLVIPSYTNGHLDFNTTVPVEKVEFNQFSEELTYLYANTPYTVQFISDKAITVDIVLGGTQLLAQNIVVGLNRISITTPATLTDNKLIISGVGANISEVVVTDTDREFMHFEGMKSVGEGGNLVITSSNNDNSQSNTQQLTHEPLRAVGDVKDRYVLIDGKWYIERNCGEVEIVSTMDISIWGAVPNTINYSFIIDAGIKNKNNISDKKVFICVNHKYYSRNYFPTNDIAGISDSQTQGRILIRIPSTQLTDFSVDAFKIWLSNNPFKIVYQLASPIYEEINYNPFETYSDITHITTNSTIPCNVTVKNHGYNLVALKENTQYTLYVNKDTTNALTYRLGDYVEVNSPSKFTFTTPSTLTDKTLRIDGKGAKVKDLMLIEGTPVNDSIGYFDGLKSSYECEQVTDESDENYGKYKVDVKVVGKNLFNHSLVKGYFEESTGNPLDWMEYVRCDDFIPCRSNTQYTSKFLYGSNIKYFRIYFYDANKNFITSVYPNGTSPFNAHYMRLGSYCEKSFTLVDFTKIKDVQIEEGDTATEYEPYFESKQTIYLNSPLLKGDEIVWKDNKIQHYHKMKIIVLDGSDDENWASNGNVADTNFRKYMCNSNTDAKRGVLTSISDKLPTVFASELKNGIINNTSTGKVQIGCTMSSVSQLKQWLQANPIKVVYELETSYYEEISDYPLKLNVIANSSLSTESTIQVTNISFNIYEETLPYLYPNTKYYITFNADVDRNNIIINLGGSHVVFDCKVGFNKVEITTPSNTTNLLTFSGTGVNIDHVKVTQQDIDEYFEGMKSVGECEGNVIEILSRNSKNLIDIIPSNWEVGTIDGNNGQNIDSTIRIRTKGFMLLPKKQDYLYHKRFGSYKLAIRFYDKDYKMINGANTPYEGFINQDKISIPNGAFYYKLVCSSIEEVNILPNEIVNNQCYLGTEKTPEPKLNKQQLTHEPLRAVGDIKDRYVLIDGKWYIERNVAEVVLDGSEDEIFDNTLNSGKKRSYRQSITFSTLDVPNSKYNELSKKSNIICDKLQNQTFDNIYNEFNTGISLWGKNNSMSNIVISNGFSNVNYLKVWLQQNPITVVYELETPIYELINYNPFEVYSDITHISNNSLIPSNIVIKNHGYNTILKPSTKYTVALNKSNGTISAKLGGSEKVDSTNSIFTITTPSTLNDNVLRLSGSGNVKDIMILEGDKTVNTPSYFEGIESAFEQEYDTEKGKYRVTARVEGNGKESSIIFYINEPLRGTGTAKDKAFIQDGKVVVERNCGEYILPINGWEELRYPPYNTGEYVQFKYTYKNLLNVKKGLWTNNPQLKCDTIPVDGIYLHWHGKGNIGIGGDDARFLITAKKSLVCFNDLDTFKIWLQQNPTTVVYQLAESIYEEADCDLSKLVLENYENSSLIFESNIPVSANIRYSGEVPVVTQAKSLSSQVDNTTLDINENIIPYMCDIDYRIVELQLMNGDTQGEGIELLGIGDVEILGNENVLFNNREDKKHNFSYDMLKRDILSQRYSKEEYQYRLDRYLLANKISDEEYKELEGLLNNGE